MHLAGDMPEYPGMARHEINESGGGVSEEEQERIQEEFQDKSNFEKVSSAVLNPGLQASTVSFGSSSTTMITGSRAETSILEALGMVWKNLLVLLVFPVVMFAIAYIKFMRMDIR
jgi:ABC-2 type transport system permease protein